MAYMECLGKTPPRRDQFECARSSLHATSIRNMLTSKTSYFPVSFTTVQKSRVCSKRYNFSNEFVVAVESNT